jgi:hypothetical protein
MSINFETITVEEFLRPLNFALDALAGVKYGQTPQTRGLGPVHTKIADIISPLLPDNIQVGTWHLTTHLPTISYVDVFQYSIDDSLDKRFEHRSRGKINRVWIEPVTYVYYAHTDTKLPLIAPTKETTMQEWFNQIERVRLEKNINENFLYREELNKKIKEAVKQADKYQDRLAQII